MLDSLIRQSSRLRDCLLRVCFIGCVPLCVMEDFVHDKREGGERRGGREREGEAREGEE